MIASAYCGMERYSVDCICEKEHEKCYCYRSMIEANEKLKE